MVGTFGAQSAFGDRRRWYNNVLPSIYNSRTSTVLRTSLCLVATKTRVTGVKRAAYCRLMTMIVAVSSSTVV